MYKILLSINPKHLNNIFNGTKHFEFRKVICSREVDTIVFYATSPVQRIVGEAKIDNILIDKPSVVWNETDEFSGISKNFFDKYFKDKKFAVAFKLVDVKKYNTSKSLSEYGIKNAPQSFIYLD